MSANWRAAFERRLGFCPDPFQLAAFDALDAGQCVVVSAPTGSGKTVIADYAVGLSLAQRRRAFYTTPLKALSNQKLGELARAYGSERVGLLTGDATIGPERDVVVMTTEVLRNMIFADAPALCDLGLVVLDEVHFLQDPYRGSVWEEVLITTAAGVQFVCLSATVSNAEQLGEWIQSLRGPTQVIVEARRPVALHHHAALAERSTRGVELIKVLDDGKLSARAAALDARVARMARRPGGLRHSRLSSPRRTEMVEALFDREMLPAIVFIFSRAGCEDAVSHCLSAGLRLTSASDRAEIRRRCEQHTEGLDDAELKVLGYGQWSAGLEAGFAAHHAGMIPAFREAVEDCFAAGLLKVVFATETLSLGINMPARTVVIEKLQKVRSSGRFDLNSSDYAQLTGRAGRRGIDNVGHAVVLWSPYVPLSEVAALATSVPSALSSSFRPTYNLAANLVRRYRSDQAHTVLDRSFAQFLDAAHHRSLSQRLDRILSLLERRGHVNVAAWELKPSGEVLSRVYHESDLLVTEALIEGVLDGLNPPSLAAVVSAFTFEARAKRWRAQPRLTRSVQDRLARLDDLASELREEEGRARLARTRHPDPTLCQASWLWSRGASLERVLEQAQLAAGDFVRNMKQVIDLARQIQLVAPEEATRECARAAADACLRGVVADRSGYQQDIDPGEAQSHTRVPPSP